MSIEKYSECWKGPQKRASKKQPSEYGTFVIPIWGQNGPIPSIFEIFSIKTLFRKLLGIYHFFWYSSLVSSSTIFFNPTWPDDMESLIKKKKLAI